MKKEIEDLKSLLTNATAVLATLEENKELLTTLSTYVTTTIDSASKFLQANLESILSTVTVSIVNCWGANLLSRCKYLSEARKELIKGGFTPNEAYDILHYKKDELELFLKKLTNDIITTIQNDTTNKKDKTSNK